MAKIYAPNKAYAGVSASVPFVNGVGESANPALLDWFREHGYQVEEPKEDKKPVKPPKSPAAAPAVAPKNAPDGSQKEGAEDA